MHSLLMFPVYCISVIIAFLYAIIILSFAAGWIKRKRSRCSIFSGYTVVSVIVAVRNEENTIRQLLSDLMQQQYPEGMLEIIIVNDHSVDRTVAISASQVSSGRIIKWYNLPPDKHGKKEALDYGINRAAGELIITTDADCRIKPGWVEAITSCYIGNNKPDMMVGMVDIMSAGGLAGIFQEIDVVSLAAVSGGSAAIGRPVLCNGANLAFKKEVYNQLHNPFNSMIVSGDDVFLLQQFKKCRKRIAGIFHLESLVVTRPAASVSDFANQRIRWASKARFYSDRGIILTGLVVMLYNFLLIFSFVLLLTNKSASLFVLLFGFKVVVDYIFLLPVFSFFGKLRLTPFCMLFQIIYPLYAVFFSLFGSVMSYTWKGRTIEQKNPAHKCRIS